jgi:hypothetical protein
MAACPNPTMQHSFNTVDQFDTISPEGDSGETLKKEASRLMGRQSELQNAAEEDFALVIWNGEDRLRKFPVSTGRDIMDSYRALEKNASALPDELVEVARYNIELASRDILGKSIYGEQSEEILKTAAVTNIVFVGEIDRNKFDDKVRGFNKTASEEPLYLMQNEDGGQFPLLTEEHVKVAERMMAKDQIYVRGKDAYEASRILIKRASQLGVELSEPCVTRYERDTLPGSFSEMIDSRVNAVQGDERAVNLYREFQKIASSACLVDVAEALHAIDQVSGLAPFDSSEKRANSPLGTMIPVAFDTVFPTYEEPQESGQLELDFDKVASVFSREFATQLQNEPGAIDHLTDVERRLLEGTCLA